MTRGELPDDDLEAIQRRLPDLSRLSGLVTPLSPDIIAGQFPHNSRAPIAAVCLADALGRMHEIDLALHEFHSHRIWYRNKKNPPEHMTATWLERFFLDDAALRLYAAWQDLRHAIRFMESPSKQDLSRHKPPRDDPRSSESLWLQQQRPTLRLTREMSTLESSPAWAFVLKYRHAWVHGQPTTIEGLGLVFKRRLRWEPFMGGPAMHLALGGSDKPEHNIDQVHQAVDTVFRSLIETLQAAAERYHEALSKAGITVDVANCSLLVRAL